MSVLVDETEQKVRELILSNPDTVMPEQAICAAVGAGTWEARAEINSLMLVLHEEGEVQWFAFASSRRSPA